MGLCSRLRILEPLTRGEHDSAMFRRGLGRWTNLEGLCGVQVVLNRLFQAEQTIDELLDIAGHVMVTLRCA